MSKVRSFKAFAFERLYNKNLAQLRCMVDGRQEESVVNQKTTKWIEFQANTLGNYKDFTVFTDYFFFGQTIAV